MASFLTGGTGNTQAVIKYDALQVGTSQYDLPIVIFWGQRRLSFNTLWYNDFEAKRVKAKGKGASSKGGQQYTYTAAVILGLGEGVIDEVLNVWEAASTTTVTTLAELGFVFFDGDAAQTPWSFVVSEYPDEALSYAYTSYVANPRLNLGASATVPELAFECRRVMDFTDVLTTDGFENPTSHAITPGKDVNLADCIYDLMTNTQYGTVLGAGVFDETLDTYSEYCTEQELYFSPYLSNQETVVDVLARWATLSNSWIYFNGIGFTFVPLAEHDVGTFSPDLTPAYNLGLDDFTDEEPVRVRRKDPADCTNKLVLQFTDRVKGYVANTAEFKDQTLIDDVGLVDGGSSNADEVTLQSVADTIVRLQGQRAAYIRNEYEFSTTGRFIRLIPGSIVTLTQPNINLDQVAVRIRTVDEDEEGFLRFVAEELPGVSGAGANTPAQPTPPTPFPNNRIDPGNVNTPSIVEPNSQYSGRAQLLISASGGPNWGGCHVWVSFDLGTTYTRIGQITQPAMQGVLTANLASHAAGLDTTNVLEVDLEESGQEPEPVTHADADTYRTLSQIVAQPTPTLGVLVFPTQGELISIGEVTATGTYTADAEYLYRGVYGSTAGAHSTGDQYTLLDASLTDGCTLGFNFPSSYIGGPLRFKFSSYNSFGEMTQDLSLVDEYEYTPTGLGYGSGTDGVPSTPATPTVTVLSYDSIGVQWAANPVADNVQVYAVWRAAGLGGVFGSATKIWSGNTTYFKDVGLDVSTGYTYFIVATNAVGDSGPSAGDDGTTPASPYIESTPSLDAIAPLVPAADTFIYFTGPTTAALGTVTSYIRGLMDDTNVAGAQSTLQLTPGTYTQAHSALLDDFAGLTQAANKLPYMDSATTMATTDLSSYSRTLLDDTTATAWRSTLGLGTIATQSASSVAITGGTITGITDLAVADGGTGASTAIGAIDALFTQGTTIASAATTDLSTATGVYSIVSGSVTITALGIVPAGSIRIVRFSGAPLITHNATSLYLPGLADIQAASGDSAIFVSHGSGNWRCIHYEPASELPVNRGGTGAVTLTGIVKGNGTSAFSSASAGTDYYAPGSTDVAVADGGTGASTASGARTNLGLVIGTNVQAYNARLADIATNLSATSGTVEKTGADTFGVYTVSTYGKSLIDDADATAARATLGLGSIATQAASSVAITGGTVAGVTITGATIQPSANTTSLRENYAPNPCFEFWQRLTTLTLTSGVKARVADCIQAYRNATNGKISRQTGFRGSKYALRVEKTAGTNNSVIQILIQIPSYIVKLLAGKTVAFAIDAVAGAGWTGTSINATLFTGDTGEDENFNPAGTPAFASGTTTSTSFWSGKVPTTTAARFTDVGVTMPSNATEAVIRLIVVQSAGTGGATDYVDFTNMDFGLGAGLGEFVPVPYMRVLEYCLREYQKSFELDTVPAAAVGAASGEIRARAIAAGAAAQFLGVVDFKVPMRIVPAITFFSPNIAGAEAYDQTAAAALTATAAANNVNRKTFEITATGAAGTAVNNVLGVHWTAEAGFPIV